MEFDIIYASIIIENESDFAKKIIDKNFWKTLAYNKKDLDKLIKSI